MRRLRRATLRLAGAFAVVGLVGSALAASPPGQDDGAGGVQIVPTSDGEPAPGAAEPEPDDGEPAPGAAEPELEPDPGAAEPEPDDGEPVGPPELPPDGLAHRPYLPAIDRDMISPHQRGAGRGTAQLSLARVGEDLFADLNLVYVFETGPWRIAPRLPLRLRIEDEPPTTDDLIRTEDWDEVSDWARLLAFVQLGRHGDPYYLRYGELNGVTVGHGSLVNRYFNSVDIDHYHGGVFGSVDLGLVGGEALLDNVFDPELLVGRAYVRPFDPLDWPLPARKLKLGVTLGADFTAPLAVREDGGKLFADPDWTPEVLSDEVAGLFSVDLEVPALSLPHIDVVPYLDFATVDGKGVGFHLGTYVNVRFNKASSWRSRIEYRWLGDRYLPGYVSPFYEIERYSYLGGRPKLRQLRDSEVGGAHNGFYYEGDLRLSGLMRYTLIYATSGRKRGHDLLMRLRLPHLGPLRLTLFFARLGFDGFDNLFAADRSVGGASARVLLAEYFFVRTALVNEWWLDRGEDGRQRFETTLNFTLGGGVLIRL